MGIYIKGMEMPTSCDLCIFDNGINCMVYPPSEDMVYDVADGTPDWCPLVSAADVWPNKTNGDMLRRMDNNNLAEWIADRFCPLGQKKQIFRQEWNDWLNKEVGE